MTVQVRTFNASKTTLQLALDATPKLVVFHDPSIVNERTFSGDEIPLGHSFPVVMDHPRRNRFAIVARGADGTFKVR